MAARAWQSGRIKLRKGEPLTFYLYTSTCFLDLPREIRDRIYHEALVALEPIIVCSLDLKPKDYLFPIPDDEDRPTHEEKYVQSHEDPILGELAMSLFRTSIQIANEAKAVFYSFNTFHIGGTQVWNPLYGFLDMIGSRNRSLLRKISVELDKPERLRTDDHGARLICRQHRFPFQRVVSCGHKKDEDDRNRGAYLADPAIEACFRILGTAGSTLEMELQLKPPFLPGVNVWVDDPSSSDEAGHPWYSLELPDFIERCRREFAPGVELLWTGIGKQDLFLESVEKIEARGWEILETRAECRVPPCWDVFPHIKLHFIVRRSAI